MTKLEKMARKLNDDFRDILIAEMREKFGIEVENYFDILGSMRLITTRVDEKAFTPKQLAHLRAFSDGYGKAMDIVRRGTP